MDWRHVLLNVLNELQKNVEILFNLAEEFSEEEVEHNFFVYLHNSLAYPKITMRKPSNWCNYQIANLFIQRIHQEKINITTFQKVALGCTRRPKTKSQLKSLHDIEISYQTERMLRLDLIADLQHRLTQINEKESSTFRVAKICSEKARQDIEEKFKEPKEKLQIHCQMLEDKLAVQLSENAATYQQLVKCRTKVGLDIEEQTRKMEEEEEFSQTLITKLRSEAQEAAMKLAALTDELEIVSTRYEEIVEENRQYMEIQEKMREESNRREEAAICIQRWFRMQRFRRMNRRKKKLKRFKPAANSKQENTLRETKKISVSARKIKETPPNANVTNITKVPQGVSPPKKRIQKQKSIPSAGKVEGKAIEMNDQFSQTDNRVPVSKKISKF